VAQHTAELLDRPLCELRIVSAHLDNGCSATTVCAILARSSQHLAFAWEPLPFEPPAPDVVLAEALGRRGFRTSLSDA
jgi:hypothetical protein